MELGIQEEPHIGDSRENGGLGSGLLGLQK